MIERIVNDFAFNLMTVDFLNAVKFREIHTTVMTI